jgi:hypothetical protein
MKKYIKLSVSLLLAVLLLAGLTLGVSAAGTAAGDGLEVTLLTDQGTYTEDGDILLTVSVKNTNAYAVEGIQVEALLPEGYELAGEAPAPIDVPAGETGTATMRVRLTGNASDVSHPWGIWLTVGLLLVAAAIAAVLVIRRKKAAKVMSLLLCAAMVLGLLPATVRAEDPSFTLDKTVTVGEKTVTLRCRVRYPIAPEQVTPREDGQIHPILQELYQVNPDETDADGDGLNNYTEICVTGTDPNVVDTNGNGINDADEDYDEDGLSNANELRNGTDLNKADTDHDGLTDGQEVNLWHTDPTSPDTDGDGLPDGDETVLGLDPLVAKTDGVTPDAQRKFIQTLSEDNIDDRLVAETSDARPSLRVNTSGNINSHAVIRGAQSYLFTDSRAIVGEPVNLITDDTADQQMRFTLSDRAVTTWDDGVTNANLICRYTPGGAVEYLDSDFDAESNTVSANVDGEGTYFVLNVRSLVEEMAVANASASAQADIVFIIDTTGSMGDEIAGIQENVDDFVNSLNSNGISAALGLVTYEDMMVDGYDSTQIHKNGASNWFYSVSAFRSALSALELGVGGDAPECVVDALETARLMDLRGSAGKLFVLVTDAPCKTDNRYGISSLEAEIELLKNAGVTCAVVAPQDLQEEYAALSQTGLFLDMNSDFYDDLVLLTRQVTATRTGDGAWIYLDGPVPVPVHLKEMPYAGSTVDTDGDHIPDIDELAGPEPIGTVDLDALIAEVSKGAVTNTDYGIVNVYGYNSNPAETDTDFDGVDDRYDSNPNDNSFGGIMHYDDGKNKANISFNVDYSLFFEPNTVYYNDLSKLAILYASDIYSGCYLEINQGASGGTDEATSFGKLFGMQDAEDIHITASEYAEDKDDLTEFFVGHRTVYRSGEKKELVILSVRGTNGTNAEWTSNFDVGADTVDYYSAVGFDHPHWKDLANHKGFDVATNRVLEKFAAYEKRHGLDKLSNKVILITGHSRGAAIANLLGAHFEDRADYKSYTYTFAAPYATTHTDAGSYRTVFNVVNSDDLVPYLPMNEWGFKKYGLTYTLSVNDLYEDDNWFGNKEGSFEWLCGYDYNDNGGIKGALEAFNKLATNRVQLYLLDSTSDGKCNIGNASHWSQSAAEQRKKDLEAELGSVKLARFVSIGVRQSGLMWIAEVNYSPAYLMQNLANMASSTGPLTGYDTKGKYASAKSAFINCFINGMVHPHQQVTYYLMAHNKLEPLS